MSIPMYLGPKALLAIFSDDLETIDSDGDGMIDLGSMFLPGMMRIVEDLLLNGQEH